MAKFWDRLLETKISFNDEIKFIEKLLKRRYNQRRFNSSVTLYSAIENNFMSWSFRQNFISLDDCMRCTGITAIIRKSSGEIRKVIEQPLNVPFPVSAGTRVAIQECKVDDYLDYAEFLINIMPLAIIDEPVSTANYPRGVLYGNFDHVTGGRLEKFEPSVMVSIVENIKNTIEKANHQIVRANKVFRIVPKDPVVLDVATKISESAPKLTDDILLYGHRTSSGNLKEKGAILARLHIYFEGLLTKLLKANGYAPLAKDIGFIANKVPEIRHAVGDKYSEAFDKLPPAEKEVWFDKLFTLFLCAIELREYSSIHQDIAAFIKGVDA